jgi:hypothetical protein
MCQRKRRRCDPATDKLTTDNRSVLTESLIRPMALSKFIIYEISERLLVFFFMISLFSQIFFCTAEDVNKHKFPGILYSSTYDSQIMDNLPDDFEAILDLLYNVIKF